MMSLALSLFFLKPLDFSSFAFGAAGGALGAKRTDIHKIPISIVSEKSQQRRTEIWFYTDLVSFGLAFFSSPHTVTTSSRHIP